MVLQAVAMLDFQLTGRQIAGVIIFNSESLDFPCSCAAQHAELTEYFFTKICAVIGEGGHLQQGRL